MTTARLVPAVVGFVIVAVGSAWTVAVVACLTSWVLVGRLRPVPGDLVRWLVGITLATMFVYTLQPRF